MKRRCLNERHHSYPSYGGRGIKICDRWLYGEHNRNGFECFVGDIGARPSSQHSIDRRDNDGHYEPNNCRWATKQEQVRNRRTVKREPSTGVIL
jgi:hypothetical protein